MRNNLKKYLILVLSLAMVFTMSAFPAYAEQTDGDEIAEITLTVDNGFLSWTPVEGATGYMLEYFNARRSINEEENGHYDLDNEIYWDMYSHGGVTSTDINILMEAYNGTQVIGRGTLTYHYDHVESVITLSVKNGVLSWTEAEGAVVYNLYIDYNEVQLYAQDNGTLNVNDLIDRWIRKGIIDKSQDSKYEFEMWALDEYDRVKGTGKLTYRYYTDAVYTEPAVITLKVEDGLLSWTPVEEARGYILYIGDYGEWVASDQNGSLNIDKMIDLRIRTGDIEKPLDGDYELLLQALDEDEDEIGGGTLTYHYESSAEYVEPIVMNLSVDGGILSWTSVEDAYEYYLWINGGWCLSQYADDNGNINLNDLIDSRIRSGYIEKPIDGNYTLEMQAHDEDYVILGKGTMTYHYESTAEYVEPVEMTAWIEGGILHWNAVDDAVCYECALDGNGYFVEGLSFDLESFADWLYTKGNISKDENHFVVVFAYDADDNIVGQWDGTFEYIPKTMAYKLITEIEISDVYTDLKAGEKIIFTTKIGTENVSMDEEFWFTDSGEYIHADSSYTPKKGDVFNYTLVLGISGFEYQFAPNDDLVIKYNGIPVNPDISRYSDDYILLANLVPAVMIGNDSADKMDRIAGSNRFETAFLTADKLLKRLKDQYGYIKYENVVIASGINFPDALAGAYLAAQKGAPLLLASKAEAANVADYVKKNMKAEGTVYILGGEAAVPAEMEAELKNAGIKNVKRLKGDNRYLTNLEILKEAGVEYGDLLICSGGGYADSLSASATGRPVLLVGNKLLPEQKEYLESIKDKFSGNVYAIGGEKVVTNDVFKEVCAYAKGEKERLAGSNRYLTSKAVADKFFGFVHNSVVLAYAQNYPDGLAGGPLAYNINAPLLLVDTNHFDAAKEYAAAHGAKKCIVLGGSGLISDQAALTIVS